MILVRDIFQLKFGQAREAIAVCQEGFELHMRLGFTGNPRLLTDLIGPDYYTLVLENTYDSLAAYEQAGREAFASDEWRSWYQRFVPLAAGGRREIFNVVSARTA